MIGNNAVHASVTRVLAGYAVACFVVLQLLDIVLEPLGVPVAAIRWVVLCMLAVAPLLVIVVAWKNRRDLPASSEGGSEAVQEAVFRITAAGGSAELDTARRLIHFAGTPADVQPKVFDLIEYLVRTRARVVSKDELFDKLWPSVVVTEASLTQSVKRARDLFRRNGFDKEVIRTVSRKGYQFDGAVEIADNLSDHTASVWSDILLPTAIVSTVAIVLGFVVWNSSSEQTYQPVASDAANSLVVLPFANLTPDQDFEYFSDGLTETLTSTLTTVQNLRIIARGSAFSFRDADRNYSTIASELNVAHIVEGSVQRNNGELRISARLIRAHDGYQLWSEIYSRTFDDVFAMQDEISQSIVAQMSALLATPLVLSNDLAGVTERQIDGEAYRLMLLGKSLGKVTAARSLLSAEENLRAALLIEPEFPEAKVLLARVVQLRATIGELPREPSFAEALGLIRTVLDQQPDYADAYVLQGEIQHRHFWDFAGAATSYATALELVPGDAGVHTAFSRFLSKSGDFVRSIREAEIALDLDPKSARAASSLAIRQIRARQLEQARSVIDQLRAKFPDNADLPWLETNWHIRNGSHREALQSIALEELDYLRLSLSAIALYHLGRTEQARASLDELIETDPDGSAFQIAEVYAQWGSTDAAFEWLERAFSLGDPGLAELYSSVNLEGLYADRRFQNLTERVGLPPIGGS